MELTALTWNLFHGRDFPPDPALFTWRSRLLRVSERNATHLQVNRELLEEFATLIAAATWDVALLQECPPRWAEALARRCDADPHRALTSRNSLAPLRSLLARLNPDLIASNEGGSNLTLVRGDWEIAERRELVLRPGPRPERRVMAFTRLRHPSGRRLCVANLHLSAGLARLAFAEQELLAAAGRACDWAGDQPLLLGGDLNIRPAGSAVYDQLAERHSLRGVTGPDSLDHLLTRGLETVSAARVWPPDARDIRVGERAIRLSDHAPIEANFAVE
jgi:endonuclease/exonuclease/phosphatase family metal-dependent hydrolase